MPSMRIVRLSAGEDGHSHFQDIDVDLALFERGIVSNYRSKPFEVQRALLRESPVTEGGYRCSPQRQVVVTLWGAAEIAVASGDVRVFKEGDILWAEDTTGSGHRVKELVGPRRSIVLALGEEADIARWLAP